MAKIDRWTDRPTTDDRLGFAQYRQTLVRVIATADTPITIGLFGTWGSGKTSLMQMLRNDLPQAKVNFRSLWFDAWKYDKEDALWRSLLLEALNVLRRGVDDQEIDDLQASLYHDVEDRDTGFEIDWREATKASLKLGMAFLPFLPEFTGLFDGAKKDGPDKSAVDNLVNSVKRKQAEIQRARVQSLEQFQRNFAHLLRERLEVDQRFVVFIDDLDRCLPEKAIDILEALKLFLDAPQCVFVVGVERRVIEEGIKVKYRSFLGQDGHIPIDGDEYLEKIVQIPFHLPPLETDNIEEFARASLEGEDYQEAVATILAQGMEANPRKIKRVLNIFRLLWDLAQRRMEAEREKLENSDDEIEAIFPDLLAKLVVIQTRWRDDLYAQLLDYPNLLENLEDHFEREQRAEERRDERAPTEIEEQPSDSAEGATKEVLEPRATESPTADVSEGTLVGQYAQLKPLRQMLLIAPETARRFQGVDLRPYIYLTTTVSTRERAEPATPLDERLWADLTSDDPTRIQAATSNLDERQLAQSQQRLLSIIENQHDNDIKGRIAAGNALGILGDPRLLEPKMIEIPAGPFLMGSTDEDKNAEDNEKPQREVHLDAYEICKYPVTNYQYQAFLDANEDHDEPGNWSNRAYPVGTANHPVVTVSWHNAQAYIQWLSKSTGQEYRLPSEAEWEKAARGPEGLIYPWGNNFDSALCNTEETDLGGTTPVGIYPNGASPYGMLDMEGNAWEWCMDWYGSNYYSEGPTENPKRPEDGTGRIFRGGSWGDAPRFARCACRLVNRPGLRNTYVGFRLSRTL